MVGMEHELEFKYWVYVLDESGTDDAVCSRKVMFERKFSVAIRLLVNVRDLQLECLEHCS